jgi:hypothetical protein
MSTTAISAVEPRRRIVVTGKVLSVIWYERPWVRTDVELGDGTGVIILRFMGRSGMPGFEPERRLVAHGTPALDKGTFVMLNPLYTFESDG